MQENYSGHHAPGIPGWSPMEEARKVTTVSGPLKACIHIRSPPVDGLLL
jgi:hypothetical protein